MAVHLATAIRGINSASQIAQKLGLQLVQVESALNFLVSHGLVEKRASEFHFAKGSIHISEQSAWVQFHHNNWRQKALADAQLKNPSSLHFTNVLTITAEDSERIQELMNRSIEQTMKIARPSEPETMACLNVDFFNLA